MTSIRSVGAPTVAAQERPQTPAADTEQAAPAPPKGWHGAPRRAQATGAVLASRPSPEAIATTTVASLLSKPTELVAMLAKQPHEEILWQAALKAVRAQPDLAPYAAAAAHVPQAAALRLGIAEERSARALATVPNANTLGRASGQAGSVASTVRAGLERSLGPGNADALASFERAQGGELRALDAAVHGPQDPGASTLAFAAHALRPPGGTVELVLGAHGPHAPSQPILLRTTDATGAQRLYDVPPGVPRVQLNQALLAHPALAASYMKAAASVAPPNALLHGVAEVPRGPLLEPETQVLSALARMPEKDRAALFAALDAKAPLGGLAKPIAGIRPYAAVDLGPRLDGAVAPGAVRTSLDGIDGLGRMQALALRDAKTLYAPVFLKYAERGTKPETVTGTDVDNLVGMALQLPMKQAMADPSYVPAAGENFFAAAQEAQIAPVANQVRAITAARGHGAQAEVTLLPIVLTTPDERVTELPLFKVRGPKGDEFVDTVGRRYSSFEDFTHSNLLPPGVMTVPTNGELKVLDGVSVETQTLHTPKTVDTFAERALAVADKVALVGGVALGAAVILGTGGTALLAAGAVLGAYGAATSGAALLDRARHGETLSVLDPGARQSWYGMASSALMLTGMGAARLASLGKSAATVASASFVGANAIDAASTAETGIFATQHWSALSTRDRLALATNVALFGVGVRASGGLRSAFDFREIRGQMLGIEPSGAK